LSKTYEMNFDEFLTKKKVDVDKLKQLNSQLYNALLIEYNTLGAKAFDQRKKFIFNELRIWAGK
jgi:hypothetical protein